MRYAGSDGVVTYVVCRYNPTANNKVEYGTTYQQHRRFYINKQKDLTCIIKRFVNDLIKKLETWREEGARIVLCADSNENIYDKSLGKRLTSTSCLNMKEVVRKNIRRHRLMAKILAIHQSRLPPKIKKMKLDKIDLDSQQYMKKAEKKCRQIKSGRIPFSP